MWYRREELQRRSRWRYDRSIRDYRDPTYYRLIFIVFWAATALAALAHPGHIVIYAPGDLRACRLVAIQNP
ncbi:hypothetical protein DUP81_19440 [Salmonella enterica subsp. enterica serovar Kingston]|nr:hypothetical protein [Salmonella enterica subsp. enterica serovar Kingston]EBV2943148.1 hypothetical protein [Salmonella enterica subsp. enterica serovar Woodhull]EBV0921830.1 hypothetical protein [Salmonella enterica subsp. enterica serovar Kingston]EBX2519766.1 hypothetical protein [Salmonella enterica subsp. enterica serovar Kingston]EBY0211936.1 hypothetical protein [Salmonella enterica subsp. enterica serovar Kingston]